MLIVSIFAGILFIGSILGEKISNAQNVNNDIELSEEEKYLNSECKKAIYDAYAKMNKEDFNASSRIGNATMYEFYSSVNNSSCYFKSETLGMPDIYYNENGNMLYYEYGTDCDIPDGEQYDQWNRASSDRTDALLQYLTNRKNEIFINYLDYAYEKTITVNDNVNYNNEECVELQFSYDNSKIFETLNGFGYSGDSEENKSDMDIYKIRYYVSKDTNMLIAIEDYIGETITFTWAEWQIPSGLEVTNPFEADAEKINDL